MPQSFNAKLTARGPGGAWTFMSVPFDVAAVFGTRARVAVAGTMNGFAFRNSLMPEGDGTHSMAVSKELQAGARAAAGDVVYVVLHVDRTERVVTVPEELAAALAADAQAQAIFAKLAASHRQEFAEWVGGAKKAETRTGRAAKAVGMIVAKQRVK